MRERRSEERRRATKTMRGKLDGVREKVQKERKGETRVNEREREAANAVGLLLHPANKEHRRAEGDCRRSRSGVVESFAGEGARECRKRGWGRRVGGLSLRALLPQLRAESGTHFSQSLFLFRDVTRGGAGKWGNKRAPEEPR